jgi:hypothetical protein
MCVSLLLCCGDAVLEERNVRTEVRAAAGGAKVALREYGSDLLMVEAYSDAKRSCESLVALVEVERVH